MLSTSNSRFFVNRLLVRSFLVGALATLGVTVGITPDLTQNAPFSLETAAYAQSVSNDDIRNYAQAVLAMEPLRQSAYNDIKRIIGSEPANIVCSQPSSFNNLPRNARNIAVNYCNRSREIVRRYFSDLSRFNTITEQVQGSDDLKRKVQNAMIELQR
ncbi:MAG: DUF4168 domain-containing protein [Jaaginema sp. PMC 1079.18]|nr:DUF4168 domain-containing protein [Jaaginema sp. PMC 1080.18]MEC4851654.1 DUF4168 domain-containing protein [Jaaginema sp. PMC 1079.18]MEC4867324.1 DUF4168 domain-containing protein [Jaaginema sp. PMC 1078.18]